MSLIIRMKTEAWTELVYDLCIVGSGPAGIMLALEFAQKNPGAKVLLLEYGARNQGKKNSLDDSIKVKNLLNHHEPYECTNKGFGGSSASWGGRCVMFDEVDFMDRAVLNGGCTWNLALYQELCRYKQAAANYFECGTAVFNLHQQEQSLYKPIAEGFKEGLVTDSMLERWSKPTRFGERYAREIAALPNLYLAEACEARVFADPDKEGQVAGLFVQKMGKPDYLEIKARNFVLAAGGQESTRLLLRNKQLFKNLEEVPAALGRYYQGHISGKIASVKFRGDPRKTDWGFIRDADGTYTRRRFQFTTEHLLEQNSLNIAIWLDNPLYFNPAHRSGAMSFMYLAMLMPFLGKRLAPPAIAHAVTKGKVQGIAKHLYNILKDFPASLEKPAQIFYKRYCQSRKLPGVFLYSPENKYALHFHAEQTPHPDNCMKLGADGETLEIDYNIQDADVDSVIRQHESLDSWLRKGDCGRLEYWYPKEELPGAIRKMSRDGIHQTGTTRIADSPQVGVVDTNLRLWGTSNVYVCSSSVFPTSGQANPTFLLGTFALRLADHLSAKVSQEKLKAEAAVC